MPMSSPESQVVACRGALGQEKQKGAGPDQEQHTSPAETAAGRRRLALVRRFFCSARRPHRRAPSATSRCPSSPASTPCGSPPPPPGPSLGAEVVRARLCCERWRPPCEGVLRSATIGDMWAPSQPQQGVILPSWSFAHHTGVIPKLAHVMLRGSPACLLDFAVFSFRGFPQGGSHTTCEHY